MMHCDMLSAGAVVQEDWRCTDSAVESQVWRKTITGNLCLSYVWALRECIPSPRATQPECMAFTLSQACTGNEHRKKSILSQSYAVLFLCNLIVRELMFIVFDPMINLCLITDRLITALRRAKLYKLGSTSPVESQPRNQMESVRRRKKERRSDDNAVVGPILLSFCNNCQRTVEHRIALPVVSYVSFCCKQLLTYYVLLFISYFAFCALTLLEGRHQVCKVSLQPARFFVGGCFRSSAWSMVIVEEQATEVELCLSNIVGVVQLSTWMCFFVCTPYTI